jgi:hypothetical protein
VLRTTAPWCLDAAMQRGADYLESWLNGTQTIQQRPELKFIRPKTITEIIADDVSTPDFKSGEWQDFASSFAQELKVKNKAIKRVAPKVHPRNPDGVYGAAMLSSGESLSISGVSALISDSDF